MKPLFEEIKTVLVTLKETAEYECDTNDKWQTRRGQIQAFNWISNLPTIVENRLELLQEEASDVIDDV